MAYETITTIANTAARPGSPTDGMIRYQTDLQSMIVYDSGAAAWKVFTPDQKPYDIEGDESNMLSVTPNFHFDATMIDGSSTAAGDNPVDTQQFDGTVDSDNPTGGIWTSRTNNVQTRIQATAGLQPTYYTSGTNSNPYFALTADELDILEYNKNCVSTGPFTHFVVCSKTADDSGYATTGGYLQDQTAWSNASVTSKVQGWINFSSGLEFMNYSSGEQSVNQTRADIDGATATYAVTRMFLYTRDGSNNHDLFVDGANQNTSLAGTYANTNMVWDKLFASTYASSNAWRATGNYYEIAFWDSLLSDADKNKLITYVNAKYGTGRNAADDGDFARVAF